MTQSPDRTGARAAWVAPAAAAVAVATVAASSIASAPPRGWLVGLSAAVLVGLIARPWAGQLLLIPAALLGYLVAAAAPWDAAGLVVLAVALAALTAVQPRQRRPTVIAVILATAPAVGIAAFVVQRSGWADEAVRLGEMVTGLAAGGVVALAVAVTIDRAPAYGRHLPQRACAVGLIAVGLTIAVLARDPALPAWHGVAATLEAPDRALHSRAAIDRTVRILETLGAAGFADASLAWVSVALTENADPDVLRRHCPRHRRVGAVGDRWAARILAGRVACRAARSWPEEGAALAAAWAQEKSGPDGADVEAQAVGSMFTRLAGDLLLEAGDLTGARDAYLSADAAGDAFARRNLVRGLLDRNRVDEARAVAAVDDPLTSIWLDTSPTDSRAWRAWNRSLDFSTLEPARRAGLVDLGVPGALTSFFEPSIGRRVATALTKYVHGFVVSVPLPPGGQVPGELRLRFRSRRGIRLVLTTVDGDELYYTCRTFSGLKEKKVVILPEPGCSDGWSDAVLRPAGQLSGRLASIRLSGQYAIARLAGSPPIPAQ
ncbi:MAG: hypothetical protein V3T05_11105 [Myxococcota bacterium]